MELYFSSEGECKVKQFNHVRNMIENFSEKIGKKVSLTPASNHLYNRGEGLLLSENEKEIFHSTVAKVLYVSTRSRPDIIPTVSGVQEPTTNNDKEKLVRLLQYLNVTRKLHLTLRYDGLSCQMAY